MRRGGEGVTGLWTQLFNQSRPDAKHAVFIVNVLEKKLKNQTDAKQNKNLKNRPHAKHAVFIVNVLESKEIEKYFFLTKSNLSKIGTRAKQCNIPYKHKKLRIILRKWLTT